MRTIHGLETVGVFERNQTAYTDQLKSRYEIYDDRVEVYDIVWGDAVLDHPIFPELLNHDAFRRLQTIEQLTLPDRYKTIPGSTQFSRFEHSVGCAVLAQKLAREAGYDERQTLEITLKALLHDLATTAHSHAGDWIKQGVGKAENHHDLRRPSYGELTGIAESLRRYGFEPAEILSEKHDGVLNKPMPDIDDDRIDYTLRESYRWVNQIPEYRSLLNKDSFTIRDGSIVCKDKTAAKLLAVSYVLLATEHWQEPAHRLQLELFMESIKRIFVARTDRYEDVGTYNPMDFLMVTDDTLQRLADDHDEHLPIMHELMRGVSESETSGRWRARADRVRAALSTAVGSESQQIDWIATHYDKLPRSYEIEPADTSTLRSSRYATVLNLKKMRKRSIDPLFIDDDGNVQRLSEEDKSYREYEKVATANVQKDWRAAIIGNRMATDALKNCLIENEKAWPAVMQRPHMPNAVLRELLRETVRTSNGAASRFIICNIH